MTLVSIDASTNKTGVSLWKNKYVSSDLLDYSSIRDTDERIKQMSTALWQYLTKNKPSIVYIEDTYCGKNPSVQTMLNRIQGVVYAWCLTKKAKFVLLKPSQWRKYISGFPNGRGIKREEEKAYSIQYVKKHYKLDVGDDIADSILIGEAALVIESR